jgi:ribosomal protein L29
VSKSSKNLQGLRELPVDELKAKLSETRDVLFRLQLGL